VNEKKVNGKVNEKLKSENVQKEQFSE